MLFLLTSCIFTLCWSHNLWRCKVSLLGHPVQPFHDLFFFSFLFFSSFFFPPSNAIPSPALLTAEPCKTRFPRRSGRICLPSCCCCYFSFPLPNVHLAMGSMTRRAVESDHPAVHCSTRLRAFLRWLACFPEAYGFLHGSSLLRGEELVDESNALCISCRMLKFDALFRPDQEGSPELLDQVAFMPYVALIQQPCPLCRLFGTVVRGARDRSRYAHEALVDSSNGLELWAVNILNKTQRSLALSYPPSAYSAGILVHPKADVRGHRRQRSRMASHIQHEQDISHHENGLIMPSKLDKSTRAPASPYQAKRLSRRCVDYKLLRQWIDTCSKEHPQFCATPRHADQLLRIKLIDCSRKKVRRFTPGVEYLALSYVWGHHELTDTEDQGKSLPLPPPPTLTDCPRTIDDAMTVTLKLGYRYLWVDQFCVDQDDAEDETEQLAIMDYIFEGATATIVAAAGNNMYHGLPGAGTKPYVLRDPQPAIRVGDTALVSTMPDAALMLRKSKWVTRAWTYQEATLSRRCLMFTPSQVYFICQTTCLSEALPIMPMLEWSRTVEQDLVHVFEHQPMPGTPNPGRSNPGTPNLGRSNASTPNLGTPNSGDRRRSLAISPAFQRHSIHSNTLERHIQMYSTRTLTYPEDALNAFRGILNRSPVWSYWGVPIVSERDCFRPQAGDVLPGTTSPASSRSNGLNTILETDSAKRSRGPSPPGRFARHSTITDEEVLCGFCHGLSWCVASPSHPKRRQGIPTWSWLSLDEVNLMFSSTDAPDPNLQARSKFCNVKIWLQTTPIDAGHPEPKWTPFPTLWRYSSRKVMHEWGLSMMIEGPVENVLKLGVVRPRSSNGGRWQEVVYRLYVRDKRTSSPNGWRTSPSLTLMGTLILDSRYHLPPSRHRGPSDMLLSHDFNRDLDDCEVYDLATLAWKVIKLTDAREEEHDGFNHFLVVAGTGGGGGTYRRVGIMVSRNVPDSASMKTEKIIVE